MELPSEPVKDLVQWGVVGGEGVPEFSVSFIAFKVNPPLVMNPPGEELCLGQSLPFVCCVPICGNLSPSLGEPGSSKPP